MGVKGFQGTSLLDYPGRVASLLFWGGCNLTCPFCHNPALVLEPGAYQDLDSDQLLGELASRRPFIDGVVLSGGEPSLGDDLLEFVKRLKELGLGVKLDTNGLMPEVIDALLERKLVDYLAIDLKTSLVRYPELHQGGVDTAALLKSVELALRSSVKVEYRTTCVPGWIDEAVVTEWGERIRGAALWVFQQYHAEHALAENARSLPCYSADRVRGLAELARGYVEEVRMRGL